ncbi:MAG: hypothetical protein GWM98_20710, partial [Nitrospinaceae bacterium]|nr:hypothetical protein [Nitrospinaceae bacterium]NIR56447.1 hypothetical protein [Nitrospinaceae bacterium]NIT83746.1 hypothetical protein [Nitrospinaceae bacterium]NIU98110.1 hypothetical protein [Nitrospinaceae bacterium]NIW07516.1 hypothetical protein [Nitrospinaceae bacterium]
SETFENSCLLPDEKFTLLMATIQAFTNEPKRYTQKLDVLKKALHLLGQSNYSDARLSQTLEFEIRKTETELEIYNSAMRAPCRHEFDQQRLIVQSEAPHYFLDLAQKRAAAYYRDKFTLSREAKAAQHFGGKGRKFEPKNQDVHREFPGACGPFMNSRVNAFHLLLPFDLKISRQPDDPLDAGVRIFYSKNGYSFPLTCEMDRLCSYYDGEVLEIP